MPFNRNSELCTSLRTPICHSPLLPRPPLPLIPPSRNPSGNHPQAKILLLLSLITTATLVGAIFMLCLLVKKLREWTNSRRNGPALFYAQQQTSSDVDESPPVTDHHVWLIHTVGLHQSVIDSITMFKYSKDEKLIDGSDCSICLTEFQENESLRLLPKCSHAFHVPCIDMWLRSHKNCPLCRAPVMSSTSPNLTPIEPVTDPPQAIEAAQMETEVVDEENRGETSRENSEIPTKGLFVQPIRRSVSMDLVSGKGCCSNGEIGNQSLCNIVKSIQRSVAGISTERNKLEWSRHYRSQSSVLPL